MKAMRSQQGIAALTGILVIILVAAIAGVGLYVYTNNEANKVSDGTAIQQTPVSNEDAPEINTAADLDEAEDSLDKQDVDKSLDTSALDDDLNSLF